jgi:hypothetical protein
MYKFWRPNAFSIHVHTVNDLTIRCKVLLQVSKHALGTRTVANNGIQIKRRPPDEHCWLMIVSFYCR